MEVIIAVYGCFSLLLKRPKNWNARWASKMSIYSALKKRWEKRRKWILNPQGVKTPLWDQYWDWNVKQARKTLHYNDCTYNFLIECDNLIAFSISFLGIRLFFIHTGILLFKLCNIYRNTLCWNRLMEWKIENYVDLTRLGYSQNVPICTWEDNTPKIFWRVNDSW